MRRQRSALGRAALLLAACAGLPACTTDLAFRVDERLTFVTPEDRADVRLPVTIDWDIRDFEVVEPGSAEPSRDAGYFAVFVDRSPMPPGKPLRWLARNDRSCRADDGCPNEEYLRGRGVYTTTDTELRLDQLPRTNDDEKVERHRVTVVLVDTDGRRIGESAFEIVFDVERTGT